MINIFCLTYIFFKFLHKNIVMNGTYILLFFTKFFSVFLSYSVASIGNWNSEKISVARRGWKPPMWLFLASPGGENFAGLETAQTRNCGSFWTFLIFTNKITKFRDFWKKIQLFSPIFYLGFSFLKICASLFFPIFAVKLIDGHSIKHLKS